MVDAELLNVLISIDGRLGGLETRLGGVETRMGRLETRLDGLDTRMGRLEARMDGLDTRMAGLDTRMDGLETRMDGLDTRMDGLETRMAGLDTRMDGLDARMGGLETRFETLETITARAPDLRLIGHQMGTLIERVGALHASNIRAIAALNDIARDSVTPGEVEALHSEMMEFRNTEFNHEVRLRRMEEELHIAPST